MKYSHTQRRNFQEVGVYCLILVTLITLLIENSSIFKTTLHDAKEEEFRVCCEVGVLQEPEAPVLKRVDQGGGHGPGEEDVEASQAHRPADFGASVNLVLHLGAPHGHGDPGVGQDVEEPLAFGQVPESGLVLGEAAVEDGDGDPPEDDWHREEDRGLGDCEGGVFAAI